MRNCVHDPDEKQRPFVDIGMNFFNKTKQIKNSMAHKLQNMTHDKNKKALDIKI